MIKAIGILGTLKTTESKVPSNTEEVLDLLLEKINKLGCETEKVRLVDENILHGSRVDMGDDGLKVIKQISEADIVIWATPIHWGQPSSLIQKLLERMDSDDVDHLRGKKSVFLDKIAGIVVVGHEDGAQHVVGVLSNTLMWYGFCIPPESCVYWVGEAGRYGISDDAGDRRKNEYVKTMLDNASRNLVRYAKMIGDSK